MSSTKQDEEEKYIFPWPGDDNNYNLLHAARISPELYKSACDVITQRACGYMVKDGVSDKWNGYSFYDGDHDRHGLALKFIDLDVEWSTNKSKMRSAQWNAFLRIFLNTLAEIMYEKVSMSNARTMQLRGFSAKKMMQILKTTFELMFDIHHPDVTNRSHTENVLREPEGNNIRVGVSHATFTIGNKRANVCWSVGGEYDHLLCQYFRG